MFFYHILLLMLLFLVDHKFDIHQLNSKNKLIYSPFHGSGCNLPDYEMQNLYPEQHQKEVFVGIEFQLVLL